MRPSRLILWVDHESMDRLPAAICRLQQRGLEVKACPDYGCYKKYYPYVESESQFVVPLVTADDDVLYPRYWLERLVEALHAFPHIVTVRA